MQAVNMNYLSPAQTYADNKNQYTNHKSSMEGNNNDYENFMNRNAYLQKSKSMMNNNLIRMMNNPNGNKYDDYHYDNVNLSQKSNSIPSPSFSQYQNPIQNSNSIHKYNNVIHHNRSNPYEYTMNSGEYSYEEYLRESKIKRSRSDNTTEYAMNSNPSTMIHPGNYCPQEYNHNKSLNNNRFQTNNYSNYSNLSQVSNPYSYSNTNTNTNTNVMAMNQGHEETYDEMIKQKYGYDFSYLRTTPADMSGIYRNMINIIQQEPSNKGMIPERYGMKYNGYGNPSEHEESQAKKALMNSNPNQVWNPMYNTPGVNNANNTFIYNNGNRANELGYTNQSMNGNQGSMNQNSGNNYLFSPGHGNDHDHHGDDGHGHGHNPEEESDLELIEKFGCDFKLNSEEPGKKQYTMDRADELFVFYISFLRKELYKNTKTSPSLRGSDTQSSISTPINEDAPMPLSASRSNAIFNNNSISNSGSMQNLGGFGNGSSQNSNNNASSQSSYMTSQSDPYYSPPCSPLNNDDHNTNVKYCIHLILNRGKIESYINLPHECILCHHTCHMETVVETVAEIYSNRFCYNSLNHCNYCSEHECKKKCAEFNKVRVTNEDIAIDLETVESFMNKYSPGSNGAHSTSSMSDDSDVQTLAGNTSTLSNLSTKADFPMRRSSVHSSKIQNVGNTSFSDRRSESSATLAMDQSTSFDNDISRHSSRKSFSYEVDLSRRSSKKSTNYDIDLSRASSRKSTGYDGDISRSSSRKSLNHDGDISRSSSRKSYNYDGDISRSSSRKSYMTMAEGDSRLSKSNSCKSTKSAKSCDLQHQRSMNENFLRNYNLYGNDTNTTTHALKTPGESIIDDNAARAKVEISKSDSRNNFDPTGQDSSLEMESKPSNTSMASSSTTSYQEAVANTSSTAKNMAKVIENTSFENRKSDKYDKHIDTKGDPKTMQRLHRAEESRRKIKERIGYERKVLSFLEAHGGEVTEPEDVRELTEIFVKEFSFYGFILRFSMVFAIICAMFSEHSRHISYTVDSFISISKIVVFVIVKNITPITSCISALILYVRFIETMDYETAGDRYKMVRHFSELVRDEEFGHCVDKILGEYLEKVGYSKSKSSPSPSTSSFVSSPTSNNAMDEDGKESNEKMELDAKTLDDIVKMNFKSKRQINSDLPIFPSSSMNERNRNVVIDSYLLFIICLIISHKYTIDTCEYNYKNKSWYFIYTFFLKDYKNPNMTMKQFNQYEFYILCVLQYNIHISMEEYNNFDVFVKRNCSSFGKDLSLYITTNVLEKLSKAMVQQEYYKKLNSNNYKNYIFNSVINNMESKIRVFFEQVIAMVKRNTSEYNRKYNNSIQA